MQLKQLLHIQYSISLHSLHSETLSCAKQSGNMTRTAQSDKVAQHNTDQSTTHVDLHIVFKL